MQTISINRIIDSELLLIPELKGLIGKEINIKIIPKKEKK
jgi:hypothetical protein